MRQGLIFPFGGESKWIDLSLRDFPDVAWVVIAANDVTEGASRREDRQFYQKALKYAAIRRAQEAEYPAPKRRDYKVLNVPEFAHFYEVLAYFRSLFLTMQHEEFDQIFIHLGSGLMIWRLALYQCAEEFRAVAVRPYLYNKDTGALERIWIYRDLTPVERNVITLLKGIEELSLSDLAERYAQVYEGKSLSYLLKVVTHLVEAGLVDATKAGRVKTVRLSPMGRELFDPAKYERYISIIREGLTPIRS